MTNNINQQTFNKRYVFMIFFMNLIAVGMGQTLIFSILPPLGRDVGLSEIQVGSIFTASSLIFFLATPIWGRRSDKWGRKPVILVGLIGYGVGTFIFASIFYAGLTGLISGITLHIALLVSRMGQSSVMSATQPATIAYVIDITNKNNRTAGMGQIGAARSIGTILGPGIGGGLAVFGLLAPLYFAAAATLICSILVWFFLPESPNHSEIPKKSVRVSFFDHRFVSYLISGVVMYMSFSIVIQTMGFYFQDLLGLDSQKTAQTVGFAMMFAAILNLFAQGFLVQRFKWHPLKLLRMGFPVLLLGFILLSLSSSLGMLVAGMAFLGLGVGLAGPGFTAGVSLAAEDEEQGAVSGLVSACPAFGFIIGPLVGTGLYQLKPVYPYIFIILIFIPLIIFTWQIKDN